MRRTQLPLAFLVLLLAGCDCGGDPAANTCRTTSDCAADQACIDGRCMPRADVDAGPTTDGSTGMDSPVRTLLGLTIVPADPVVTSVDGAMETVDFELEASWSDGTTSPVPTGFWSIASTDIGDIDSTGGVFTANGAAGGVETVSVDALGTTASTTITVNVERNVLGDGVPADVATRFGAELDDPARRADVLYPLADTVFPQNVYPPDVQWERGDAGDVYRITFTAPRAVLRGYVIHSGGGFGFDWAIDRDAWRALAESSPGESVTWKVDRWESATSETIGGVPRAFTLADANITGSIYYWDLGGGRILRIRGDGTGLEDFLPSPPPRAGDGERCVACHTVSRDGRHMAGEIWDASSGYGAVFDLTADLTGDPAPTLVPPSVTQFITASFSPDASRLIANWRNDIFLVDATTGARLTAGGTPLPATASAQPEWSPDGMSVAHVANHNGGFWGVDFTTSDLAIIPVTGADAFGPSTVILSGGGRALARPSWSPDSGWIAFQDGVNSRSNNSGTDYPARLRLVAADGSRTVELDALNAGADNSYYPTFSPFDEGGYFWLAFFSSRDYGNAQVGTRGTGRRQLWVSAIARDPGAGPDPSHAPYWLPQQNVTRQNMAAFWSEEACRADGRTCATSGECCSGFCRDVGAGPVCVPPDVPECSMRGESCRTDADCCEGEGSCASNVCTILG